MEGNMIDVSGSENPTGISVEDSREVEMTSGSITINGQRVY